MVRKISIALKHCKTKCGTPIRRKNDGPPRKIFRPVDSDPSIYDTFRKQEKYCDITLVSADDSARIKCHRIILAAKMKRLGEAFENSLEVIMAMDANTLKMVIEYCYSKQLRVSGYEPVFQLLKAAKDYEIITLREECEEFLEASINSRTAAKFLSLSNENGFNELAIRCLSIVCENFENIVNEPHFNELSEQDFERILMSDKLCARNEKFIFTAFLKWLYKAGHMDLEKMYREGHTMPITDGISAILSHIKFPLMDEAFFDAYAQKVCEHQNRIDLVVEFNKFRLRAMVCPNVAKEMANKRMQPRRSSEKMVAFGSYGEGNCFHSEMLRMNSMQGEWIELPEIDGLKQQCVANMSFAYCGDDRVVATGGCGKITKRQAILVDLKERKIVNLPPMNVARQAHASVFFNGFLYVAGGLKSKEYLDSVERYDFNERCWTILPKMPTKRSHFSMIVADHFIYALGGKIGKMCLDAVDVYDPMNNHWGSSDPMTIRRACTSAVLYKDCIYAIGGETDGAIDSATVERYDGHQWKMMASLNMPRDLITSCVFNNTLIAAGGYDSNCEPMDIAEFYDEKDDKWHRLRSMNKARGGAVMFVTSSYYNCST